MAQKAKMLGLRHLLLGFGMVAGAVAALALLTHMAAAMRSPDAQIPSYVPMHDGVAAYQASWKSEDPSASFTVMYQDGHPVSGASTPRGIFAYRAGDTPTWKGKLAKQSPVYVTVAYKVKGQPKEDNYVYKGGHEGPFPKMPAGATDAQAVFYGWK